MSALDHEASASCRAVLARMGVPESRLDGAVRKVDGATPLDCSEFPWSVFDALLEAAKPADAIESPSDNTAIGTGILYAESGVLKWRGSDGAVIELVSLHSEAGDEELDIEQGEPRADGWIPILFNGTPRGLYDPKSGMMLPIVAPEGVHVQTPPPTLPVVDGVTGLVREDFATADGLSVISRQRIAMSAIFAFAGIDVDFRRVETDDWVEVEVRREGWQPDDPLPTDANGAASFGSFGQRAHFDAANSREETERRAYRGLFMRVIRWAAQGYEPISLADFLVRARETEREGDS